MKPDFNAMTKDELRQYVITHQADKDAFYQYVDLLKSNSSGQVYPNSMTPDEIEQAVLEHIKNNPNKVN
ncbi:MAG: hypothetical protein AB4058_07625 [Microcystaceae cyanobacterium]